MEVVSFKEKQSGMDLRSNTLHRHGKQAPAAELAKGMHLAHRKTAHWSMGLSSAPVGGFI
jgi:hypothetical protein